MPRFPLGMCIAAIVWTSLGLAAAALNIRWGAEMAQGDGTIVAWIYCNVMLTLLWLVVWPAIRGWGGGSMGMEVVALVSGAIPACSLAATVAGTPSASIVAALLVQGALAIFAGGLLAASRRVAPILLPAIGLVLPVAAFIIGDTFPQSWWAIAFAVPAIAAAESARFTSMPGGGFFFVVALYAGTGVLCGGLARISRQPRTA